MQNESRADFSVAEEANRIRESARQSSVASDDEGLRIVRSKKSQSTIGDFTGASVPAQFKLPQDLVASLKLHSINSGESMSSIVLKCLTSSDLINKAWVATRKAA